MCTMEFRKGCPACEHTDPQLERELQALAELLVDSYLERCGVRLDHISSDGIDNSADRIRLKKVDNPKIPNE